MYFEMIQSQDGSWSWHLRSADGDDIFASNEQSAESPAEAIYAVKNGATDAPVFVVDRTLRRFEVTLNETDHGVEVVPTTPA